MKAVKISPNKLKGEVVIPPSKSMSHRAIICAALGHGKSKISNLIMSKDIIATMEAMKSLGVKVIDTKKDNNDKYEIIIEGRDQLKVLNEVIDCNESGSTLRFLIPIGTLADDKVTFTGRGKLVERPMDTYYEIFEKQGIKYETNGGNLPLTLEGKLKADKYEVVGNVSSQFISGLLFTLPKLDEDSNIVITNNLESKAYIDLTLDMLGKFGIKIENKNYEEFKIDGNQKYTPKDYRVEGDFSQGAFWIVAGLIGDSIKCLDLDLGSKQGDKAILEIVEKMGGKIEYKEDGIIVHPSETKGITIDVSQCPDLVPILALLGTFSKGVTKITNGARLRIKESDRLKSISTELNKLGANIIELEDGLEIHGVEGLTGGVVNSWNDHRIAMALGIASMKCSGELTIENSSSVEKSYPSFWEDFKSLGGHVHEWNMGE
ncbi:MAG: 3-phosphoshikimate 1-carboxyvinyltransferase [Anaeromicrobium sp.]|uniref:3-phosphoshikimate 1-carboxyvinyltransferase n=1 Tax=Anaeromicrobium sp. TaxID=1929132 RepID=UPI0025DC4C9D|nr:3-phosphoshikimate 1-carboxyvinyltransferase [Anaeromicrobium sp.]MCT4595363.1 3-phosphoshikimate 1-carboxyvinyltransferase [Anaeromicrobium sp.]